MSLFPLLLPAVRQSASLLSLRLLPFAVYVLVRRRSPLVQRCAWVSAYASVVAIACWLGAWLSVGLVLGAAAYYLLVSLGLVRMGTWLASGKVTRTGAFSIAVFAYL